LLQEYKTNYFLAIAVVVVVVVVVVKIEIKFKVFLKFFFPYLHCKCVHLCILELVFCVDHQNLIKQTREKIKILITNLGLKNIYKRIARLLCKKSSSQFIYNLFERGRLVFLVYIYIYI
jgi:hypothetical protein